MEHNEPDRKRMRIAGASPMTIGKCQSISMPLSLIKSYKLVQIYWRSRDLRVHARRATRHDLKRPARALLAS